MNAVLSPVIRHDYWKATDDMLATMKKYATPVPNDWTLCKFFTPGLGLGTGMVKPRKFGRDWNNDFGFDFGPAN